MVNEKDILARLQAGESVQSIADELINAINSANEKFRAEEEEKAKKLAEEKKKAEEKAVKKTELATTIATSVMEYLALVDPKLVEDEDEELSAEEVQKLLDAVIPFMSSMKNIQTLFPASPSGKPVITLRSNDVDNADEIIKNFLTANML